MTTLAYVPYPKGGSTGFSVGNYTVVLPGQIEQVNGLVGNFGINIIHLAISLLFFGAVFLSFFFVIYGGFKWMTSEGDKKKIEEARTTIVFAIIGLVVLVLATLVVSVVGTFFGVNLLQIGN